MSSIVMRKWLLFALGMLIATGVVSAQTATPTLGPISTLEAGDFRSLAVTTSGDRLLVADAQNNQVRVYDFTDPVKPQLDTALDMSGTPVLLAGGENYGLAAVSESGDTDSVQVVAPAFPKPGAQYMAGISYIDIPKNPRALAVSPDSQWGIAVSETGYVLMEIHAADNIDWREVEQPLIDAALTDTTAYLLHDQVLESALLVSGEPLTVQETLKLNDVPTHVAINPSLSEGVVIVGQNTLVFFDPKTLKQTGEFTVSGTPVTGLSFLTKDNDEFLLIMQADSPQLALLDVKDPTQVTEVGSTQALKNPIRAVATYGKYMIITDGMTIGIYSS